MIVRFAKRFKEKIKDILSKLKFKEGVKSQKSHPQHNPKEDGAWDW